MSSWWCWTGNQRQGVACLSISQLASPPRRRCADALEAGTVSCRHRCGLVCCHPLFQPLVVSQWLDVTYDAMFQSIIALCRTVGHGNCWATVLVGLLRKILLVGLRPNQGWTSPLRFCDITMVSTSPADQQTSSTVHPRWSDWSMINSSHWLPKCQYEGTS